MCIKRMFFSNPKEIYLKTTETIIFLRADDKRKLFPTGSLPPHTKCNYICSLSQDIVRQPQTQIKTKKWMVCHISEKTKNVWDDTCQRNKKYMR